jgi:hypothetical protein
MQSDVPIRDEVMERMSDPGSTLLRTAEAAQLLNISPNTLRFCAERFGFPGSTAPGADHRQFTAREVIALRHALTSEHSLPGAVARAQAELAAADLGLHHGDRRSAL